MAIAACVKCNNKIFELSEFRPLDSRYPLFAVQCSACGCVVGVVEHRDISAMLYEQNEAIKKIGEKIEEIGQELRKMHNPNHPQ
jgi:hypothetical protein